MIFGLLYFCVVILCDNRSRTSFILYRIVKRHSRQSNVRRIWTCADNVLNVTLSIKRMFSNKPQLGLPKHYSFDIYSIRIPPTEAYQGQHFDFSKGVSRETNKKWRLMELNRLPSVRRIFFRASVCKASPGARLRARDRSPYKDEFL